MEYNLLGVKKDGCYSVICRREGIGIKCRLSRYSYSGWKLVLPKGNSHVKNYNYKYTNVGIGI